jgi:SAM-dependent methyltransferase
MSAEDKIKWDKKYQEEPRLLEQREASLFVKKYYGVASGKDALDLASGVGKNALFLEIKGFRIDAIDISSVALEVLSSKSKGSINTIEADLDTYTFSKNYDLILMCNYLDRTLINRAKESLNSGGVFIVETYIEDKSNQKKSYNPNFLLKKDELLKIFKDGFEVLEYKSFQNESYELYRMKKAAIAAKKL